MKLVLFLFTVASLVANPFAAKSKSPLNKYKLILNGEQGEQTIKSQLFTTILGDIKVNLQRNVDKLKEAEDEDVLKEFGRLNSSNEELEVSDPSVVRQNMIRQMQKRSKDIAKQVWNGLESASIDDLKANLSETVKYDLKEREEASEQFAKVEETAQTNPENAPSSPCYAPYHNGYYNYYGYNYYHNYGSYRNPYYRSYYYYRPVYNNYYRYNRYRYNNYYYNNYYYPRYNRTVGLLASGVFGLAAVGSFVDWVFN